MTVKERMNVSEKKEELECEEVLYPLIVLE
jgi:hypothetical protein